MWLANLLELHLSASKHFMMVFFWCSVWFDSSEHLQTTPQTHPSKHLEKLFYRCSVIGMVRPQIHLDQQTHGESDGVLQLFGVVRPLPTSSNYTRKHCLVVGMVRTLRTSSNYTNGQACECSTGVRCGSTPLRTTISKHLERVL